MKKILGVLLVGLIGFYGCGNDPIQPPPEYEPELVGCESSEIYDWDSLSFSTTLGQGETLWIAFEVTDMAIYSVDIDATGFECSIYDQCDPENLVEGDSLLSSFTTTGLDDIEMGVVIPGIYYVSMYNTRNRADFNFTISITDIVVGCTDDIAINYDVYANVDNGSCEYNDCSTDYYTSNYGDMVVDCDGNCSPVSWIGDYYCDDGSYCIYNEEDECIPVNLMCEELEWDLGDCEEIVEDCPNGQIEDCNGICAPESWLGDGYCDDGSYEFNGNVIFFNCEEFSNDNGDCDLGRTSPPQSKYPNGRVLMEN